MTPTQSLTAREKYRRARAYARASKRAEDFRLYRMSLSSKRRNRLMNKLAQAVMDKRAAYAWSRLPDAARRATQPPDTG